MRLKVKLIPLNGKYIKMIISGLSAGPVLFCTTLDKVIGNGVRTFHYSDWIWIAIFGSKQAVMQFMKKARPINKIIMSDVYPRIVESCDRIQYDVNHKYPQQGPNKSTYYQEMYD